MTEQTFTQEELDELKAQDRECNYQPQLTESVIGELPHHIGVSTELTPREELKKNIEILAAEECELKINNVTKLQTAAAVEGNEELLELLCDIKWDYIGTRQ